MVIKSQQPQADDHDPLAQGGVRQADALQPDRARTVKAAFIIVADTIRHTAHRFTGTQTISAWGPLEITRSPTAKPVTPSPTLQHHAPGVAITQGQRLIQDQRKHGFQRRQQAVGAASTLSSTWRTLLG